MRRTFVSITQEILLEISLKLFLLFVFLRLFFYKLPSLLAAKN